MGAPKTTLIVGEARDSRQGPVGAFVQAFDRQIHIGLPFERDPRAPGAAMLLLLEVAKAHSPLTRPTTSGTLEKMRELLNDVASRAARYLEEIKERRVGPAPDAVRGL